MDAGVLQLHVFPHQHTPRTPLRLTPPGTRIEPTLTAQSPVDSAAAVSVVIPTYFNRDLKQHSLRRSLEGLARSELVREIVLVVADDSAGRGADVDDLMPPGKTLTRVRCDPNQRARTRNLGAAAAQHDVLLFLDDDMLVRDWRSVDAVVSRLLTGGYDCALFPRRQYARFPLLYDEPRLSAAIDAWRIAPEGSDPKLIFDPVRDGCGYKTISFCFPGCFMAIRRPAFDLIGGFPEEFSGWGFEDSDFALRATAVLRVLNLFRAGEPLLHLDHPVSPYKSEEYQENLRRFTVSHDIADIDRMCDHIVSGADFASAGPRNSPRATYWAPWERLAETPELAWIAESDVNERLRANYDHTLQHRLEKSLKPLPEFAVLHGSRGAGTATESSDYDLLLVFRDGNVREFFVCGDKQGRRLELELSDSAKFENIAREPAWHPLYGPLELAKLAQGRLLYGDADDWREWSERQLTTAVTQGRLFWLLFALGMSFRPEKFGPLRDLFAKALSAVLANVDATRYARDLEELRNFDRRSLAEHLRTSLDEHLTDWRIDLWHNKRVFAFQVPEVWMALESLVQA